MAAVYCVIVLIIACECLILLSVYVPDIPLFDRHWYMNDTFISLIVTVNVSFSLFF